MVSRMSFFAFKLIDNQKFSPSITQVLPLTVSVSRFGSQDSTRTGTVWPWLHAFISLSFSMQFQDSSVSLLSHLWDCSKSISCYLSNLVFWRLVSFSRFIRFLLVSLVSSTVKTCSAITPEPMDSIRLLLHHLMKAPCWSSRLPFLWRRRNTIISPSSLSCPTFQPYSLDYVRHQITLSYLCRKKDKQQRRQTK